MTTTQKALLITAVLAVFFWPKKGNAQPNPAPVSNASGPENSFFITDYDPYWDYKFEGGAWYTKKKTSSTWLNMQLSLSATNYQIAIATLVAYAKTKKLIK